MREALINFISAPPASELFIASADELDWNKIFKLDEDTLKDHIKKAQTDGRFTRIFATVRAVSKTLNRSPKKRERFVEFQGVLLEGSKTKIL